MIAPLFILRIEIDGHHNGGPPLKPWVAEIQGPDQRYGLRREFLQPMNDWANAHRTWSGNIYGKVATYALRSGRLYEVAQPEGRSSRRHLVRKFWAVEAGKRVRTTPDEALAHVDGGGPAAIYTVREDAETWVARVTGLGTPSRLGYVVVDGKRRYRLRDGVYEVVENGARRLVGVRQPAVSPLTEREALAWLA